MATPDLCDNRPEGADTLLQDAVAALLRRIPECWTEYDADTLTATEAQALLLLVAAGMVERRIRLRMRLHNHPVAAEATMTATGEYGFVEALEPVLASMWGEWKDAYHAWRTGETRGEPLSVTEHLKPDEWRLTDQGTLARADLDGGHAERALDFVLRRGFFDGQPKLILEPGRERVSQREAVRGYGRLVTMRKVQTDAVGTPAVNIGNWQEGATAFAAAFEALAKAAFEAKAAAEGRAAPDTASAGRPKRAGTAAAGGRPPLPPDDERRREELLALWEKTGKGKLPMWQFCRRQGISTDDLKRCIEWDRKRRQRRAAPPETDSPQ